jgi:putative oxidoreductase
VRTLDRVQPFALFVLRLVLGGIMIAHGYGKLFHGLSHEVELVRSVGLPGWLAYVSAAAEFFGGIAVVVGLFTRFAAFAITIDLAVFIWKVDWKNGLLGDHGYQLPLALAAIAFALIFFDAGPIALDHARGGGGIKKPKSA